MFKTQTLVEGALISAIAAIFQLIPIFFSEIFIFFTLVSTFPIYLITRKYVQIGFFSYVTCTIIVFIFSVHESIIFLFMNGLIGVSFGYLDNYLKNKYVIISIVGSILFLSLCIVNYLIGIPVLGVSINASLIIIIGIFIFSIIYIFIYFYFIKYLVNKVTLFRQYLNRK